MGSFSGQYEPHRALVLHLSRVHGFAHALGLPSSPPGQERRTRRTRFPPSEVSTSGAWSLLQAIVECARRINPIPLEVPRECTKAEARLYLAQSRSRRSSTLPGPLQTVWPKQRGALSAHLSSIDYLRTLLCSRASLFPASRLNLALASESVFKPLQHAY